MSTSFESVTVQPDKNVWHEKETLSASEDGVSWHGRIPFARQEHKGLYVQSVSWLCQDWLGLDGSTFKL